MRVKKSHGRARGGASINYVRPESECENKSYRISSFSQEEFHKKLARVSKKLEPEISFIIDGSRIVANSEKNAMQEYWRICEKEKIGLQIKIERTENHEYSG